MEKSVQSFRLSIDHFEVIYKNFIDENNYEASEKVAFTRYKQNLDALNNVLIELNFDKELYSDKSRQMILADLIEYIFLGRGYYVMRNQENKEKFIMAILYFVNMLMTFEDMTVSNKLRKKFFKTLKNTIPSVDEEEMFLELERFTGNIGLPQKDSDATKKLNRYFDKMLPKTAGGLWHELLVYIFMLRTDVGYIIPLLLVQRFFSKLHHIVPPDFLIISHDKKMFGIEVGTKKEIQSGSFSLQTAIPSATLDTENSRCSDRCPYCKKWIQFCPFVIGNFADFSKEIEKYEVRCLEECTNFSKEEIAEGKCPYSKYRRDRAKTLAHTHHPYSDGLHYHYQCVLNNVEAKMRQKIIAAKDTVAIKTHYPYYNGLEELK